MTRRIWILCLVLVLLLAGAPPPPAMAVGEALFTDQNSYYLGQTLTLTGSGFNPWSAVALSLRYGQTLVAVDQTTSNGAGTFTATFLVAPSWSYGSYLAMAVPCSGEQTTTSFAVIPREQLTLYLLAGWNQISLPVLTATHPATVFAGLPPGWLFYAWDPALGTYLDKNHASVVVGKGYWLKVNSAISYPVTGSQNLEEETRVPLAPGWNMIGVPYAAAIAWNQVKISDGIFTYTLSAAPAGWILNTGFHYNGSTYQPVAAGGSLQALFGYWVKAKLAGLSLVFSKP